MRLLLSRLGSCRRWRSIASRTRARMSARRPRSSLTAPGARTISNRIWPDYSQNAVPWLPLMSGDHWLQRRAPSPRAAPVRSCKPLLNQSRFAADVRMRRWARKA